MNFLFCLFLVGGAVFGGVFSLLFFRSKAQRTFNIAWFPYRCICRICLVCRTKKIIGQLQLYGNLPYKCSIQKKRQIQLVVRDRMNSNCPMNFFRTMDTTDTAISD